MMGIVIAVSISIIGFLLLICYSLKEIANDFRESSQRKSEHIFRQDAEIQRLLNKNLALELETQILRTNSHDISFSNHNLTADDLKKIARWIHPDTTRKDTSDIFVKINEMRESLK